MEVINYQSNNLHWYVSKQCPEYPNLTSCFSAENASDIERLIMSFHPHVWWCFHFPIAVMSVTVQQDLLLILMQFGNSERSDDTASRTGTWHRKTGDCCNMVQGFSLMRWSWDTKDVNCLLIIQDWLTHCGLVMSYGSINLVNIG